MIVTFRMFPESQETVPELSAVTHAWREINSDGILTSLWNVCCCPEATEGLKLDVFQGCVAFWSIEAKRLRCQLAKRRHQKENGIASARKTTVSCNVNEAKENQEIRGRIYSAVLIHPYLRGCACKQKTPYSVHPMTKYFWCSDAELGHRLARFNCVPSEQQDRGSLSTASQQAALLGSQRRKISPEGRKLSNRLHSSQEVGDVLKDKVTPSLWRFAHGLGIQIHFRWINVSLHSFLSLRRLAFLSKWRISFQRCLLNTLEPPLAAITASIDILIDALNHPHGFT